MLLLLNFLLAKETRDLVRSISIEEDHDWGLDHGTWTVVRHMFPEADIPVLQLSIDHCKSARYHFEQPKELAKLRKKGVLIIGSGNMVHNLRMLAWDKIEEPEYRYDWALEMNERFKKHILDGDFNSLINFEKLGAEAELAMDVGTNCRTLLGGSGRLYRRDQAFGKAD